jgi:uncharacterized LabA/DUF88 family protein
MGNLIKTWNDLDNVNQLIHNSEIAIDNISRWPNKTSRDYQEYELITKQLAEAKEEKLRLLNQLIEDAEEEKVKVCDTIPDEEPTTYSENTFNYKEWEAAKNTVSPVSGGVFVGGKTSAPDEE